MVNYNLAIELGSSNTVIYMAGIGVVLKEPSMVAMQTINNKKVVVAVGSAAKNLVGKTNESLEIISPVVESEIVNFNVCKTMLKSFLEKVAPSGFFKKRNKVVFVCACGISKQEKKKFVQLAYSLGINQVGLIPSGVCALIGMEVEEHDPYSHMIVNMGGGATDIAIINNNHIIRGATINIGGSSIEFNIGEFLKSKLNVLFGANSIEEIKNQTATMLKNDICSISCYCLDLSTRERKKTRILSQDIYPVLQAAIDKICEASEAVLDMCSTEVLKDINKFGVYLCGGLANITGIDKYISTKLNLPVFVDVDPDSSVIMGAGNLLNNPILLNKLLMEI